MATNAKAKATKPSREGDVLTRGGEFSEQMSTKLVRAQYDFLTNVVHGAGEALRRSGKEGSTTDE
jgi:hypothetical protein